ncbi:MAG: hypothetical protein MJY56_03740 [Bacteroidales bacterium]|nr:hypothetical protein [Bacteroidales bacterium]
MKKHLLLILAFAVMAVCCEKPVDTDPVGSRGSQNLEVKVTFATKASSLQPEVSSIRLVAYDGSGQCSLNTKLTDGYSITEESDGYVLTVEEPLTLMLSSSTSYAVYAILNEDGYCYEGSDDLLSALFDALTLGSRTELKFMSYFNGRAQYEKTLAVAGAEPAFIMGASQSIAVHEGNSQTPCEVNFVTESTSLRRPFAQITVNSIVSDDNTADVASIFIRKISIENVPSGFVWGTKDAYLSDNTTRIDFAGEDDATGYYQRTDNVSYTATYSNIRLTASTDERYYYTDDKKLSFCDITSAKSSDKTNFEPKIGGDNDYMALLSGLEWKFGMLPKTLTYDSTFEITPSLWTIDLGNSYYVPECLSSSADECMYLKVLAAIASPGMTDAQIESYASSGSATYYTGDVQFPSAWSGDNTKNFLKNNLSMDSYAEGNKTKYVFYYGDLSYVQTAPEDVTSSGTGSEIVWRTVSDLVEFTVPINNQSFDGDYSVRRNTKYNVTLHIDSSTYSAMSASKAAAAPVPGIRATVTTEKICGYEE